MSDGKRLVADMATLSKPPVDRQSGLGDPAPRTTVPAKSGVADPSSSGGGGGGGGSLSEDAARARESHDVHYVTSTDGMFVFVVRRPKTIPMLDVQKNQITLTLLDR